MKYWRRPSLLLLVKNRLQVLCSRPHIRLYSTLSPSQWVSCMVNLTPSLMNGKSFCPVNNAFRKSNNKRLKVWHCIYFFFLLNLPNNTKQFSIHQDWWYLVDIDSSWCCSNQWGQALVCVWWTCGCCLDWEYEHCPGRQQETVSQQWRNHQTHRCKFTYC